ncbi:MAG: NAD-dependent epimerase/dehydratase family protein [Acidimicrobiia bacterium]
MTVASAVGDSASATRARALVTGGAGFIGSHLVEALLQRGVEVAAVDDLSTGRAANLAGVAGEVEILELDLREADVRSVLERGDFTSIFHLASHADLAASVSAPRRDLELNVLTTLNLVEAMRDTECPARLVNLSSGAVYGDRAERPFREGDPVAPTSPYSVSKLAAEHYVGVFARLFGVHAASVRPFSAYGPRQRKQVVFDLIKKIDDDPFVVHVHGDGTQVRDLNHVSNVVDALLMVSDVAPMGGEVYNIGADSPTSVATLVGLICDAMGAAPRVVWSGEVRKGDPQRLVADIGRLRALGYQPRVGLADGIADTVAWFRRDVAPPGPVHPP